MNSIIKEALKIRYVKLHYTIQLIEDCQLPMNKVSALRGGIGEMLLRSNCISDRDCEKCSFESECMVQRTMYSQYTIHPEGLSVGSKDSIGYVIECENYETDFCAGDEIKFNLILFGKTIVYFNQYMLALYALGQNGLGKYAARFIIKSVINIKGERLLYDNNIYMHNYQYQTLYDYVQYRLSSMSEISKILEFKTPVTIKHQKEFMQDFNSSAIVSAVLRRVYMLDCFEGVEADVMNSLDIVIPSIVSSEEKSIDVRRYSSRQDAKMTLKGIKGQVEFDDISEELLWLLLAAEITHIGKNTSFGFGRIRVK